MSDTISAFLRKYRATAVGNTPAQPNIPAAEDDAESDALQRTDRTVECGEADWAPQDVGMALPAPADTPQRFIDGSQTGQPVLCVRSRQGYPVALYLGEVGAVALRSEGRGFVREFAAVERVLSFVVDPFDWAEIESFARDLMNRPELRLRVLPANWPQDAHNPFDYEVLRNQARNRCVQEMESLERLAFAQDRSVTALVDGNIDRVATTPKAHEALIVGVVKTHSTNNLHSQGWQTLLQLEREQRTPVFRLTTGGTTSTTKISVATWFLKLAGTTRLAPNWGYVRVEIPWVQFTARGADRFRLVDELSRWLIQARCTTQSYGRMPVSLDPIVRAEDALKPLFTPPVVLVNRLYRTAGLFRGHES